MKLCKDCKHFGGGSEVTISMFSTVRDFPPVCLLAPKPPDFVLGGETGFYLAQAERETVTGCGAEGHWWEQK